MKTNHAAKYYSKPQEFGVIFESNLALKKSWDIIATTWFVICLFTLIFRDYPERGKGRDEKKRDVSPLGLILTNTGTQNCILSQQKYHVLHYLTSQKSAASVFKSCLQRSLILLLPAYPSVESPFIQVSLDLCSFVVLKFCQEETEQLWPFLCINPLHFTCNNLD